MSIISDALKKTQEKRSIAQGAYDPAIQLPPRNTQELNDLLGRKKLLKDLKRRPRSRRVFLRLASLSLVFVGTAAAVMYFTRFAIMNAVNEPADGVAAQTFMEIKKNVAEIRENLKNIDMVQLPTLNGIMYTPASPQAVINDTIVAEGDNVGGFSIVKISPNRVMVASGGEEFELELR